MNRYYWESEFYIQVSVSDFHHELECEYTVDQGYRQ
jgi:hypothetical protein